MGAGPGRGNKNPWPSSSAAVVVLWILFMIRSYLRTVGDVFIIHLHLAPPLQVQAHRDVGVGRGTRDGRRLKLHTLLKVES